MHPAAGCLFVCVAALTAFAAVPAAAAAMLDVTGGQDIPIAASLPGGSDLPIARNDLWGPGTGLAKPGEADGLAAVAPRLSYRHTYVIAGVIQQQGVLRNTVSGLDAGVVHTLSLGWVAGGAVPVAADQAFWGFAFNGRTYRPELSGAAAAIFAPWRQQRYAGDWGAGSRVMPFAEAPPVEAAADSQPETMPDYQVASDLSMLMPVGPIGLPEWSTVIVLAMLSGLLGLLWWFWDRVIRPATQVGRVASVWSLDARSATARRLPERGVHIADHLLDDLTPDS